MTTTLGPDFAAAVESLSNAELIEKATEILTTMAGMIETLEGLIVSMAVGLTVDEMPEREATMLRAILDEGAP